MNDTKLLCRVAAETLSDGSLVFNVMMGDELVSTPPSLQEAQTMCERLNELTPAAWALRLIAFSSFGDFECAVEWGQWCRNVATAGREEDVSALHRLERKLTKAGAVKHTPGPWQFTVRSGQHPGVAKHASALAQTGPRKMANAALVTAAPELLSALQECLDVLELPPEADAFGTCYTATSRSGLIADAKLKARAIIAKATWFEHPHWK